MSEIIENDLGKWFSTYGLITAERILGKYSISLPQDELLATLNSPFSFYHKILQIPLKNVLNGIVLQQASDYHVYVQKLFIDYLLSGETGKDATSQGAAVRESLENERNQLLVLGEEFQEIKKQQDALIASSQLVLIKLTRKWNEVLNDVVSNINLMLSDKNLKPSMIKKGVDHIIVSMDLSIPLDHQVIEVFNDKAPASLTNDVQNQLIKKLDPLVAVSEQFKEDMSGFYEKVRDLTLDVNSFRTQFYDSILRVTELLRLLPEYKIDAAQDLINRELLYFDKSIGSV